MLWRLYESIKDWPQIAKLIGVFIAGIKPFVEKIIMKEEGKDRWASTFAAMESVARELTLLHTASLQEKLS